MSITVVSIPVSDQDAALLFYRDVLRFRVLEDQPFGPDMRWLQLQPETGGSSVALITWSTAMRPGGVQGLVLHVPNIDAERERLVAAGVEATPVDEQPWGRFAMFSDPDGNGWIVATVNEPSTYASR